MGIDIILIWDGMTDADRERQTWMDADESLRRADELRRIADDGGVVTSEMIMAAAAPASFKARGMAGYILESYAVSPFPSAILVREAFEADEGAEVEIAAAIMRERLLSVTEPADHTVGLFAANLFSFLRETLPQDVEFSPNATWTPTRPASVWESVRQRCANDAAARGMTCGQHARLAREAAEMMENYTTFVELAEQREREQGHPCRVLVDQ